ncbi:MAG TPA: hypothetical protein VIX63_08290 [Vicinamibacterales bacterium]
MFFVSSLGVRGRLLMFPQPVTVGVRRSLLWRLDPAVECFVRELEDGRTFVEVLWHNSPQLSGLFPDRPAAAEWAGDVRRAFLRHGYCLPRAVLAWAATPR